MKATKLTVSKHVRMQNELRRLRFLIFPATKRAMDMLLSSLGLVILSPLLLSVAILIKLESKGSAFFKQQRVGRYGEPFTMYKFRSMHVDAETRRKELEENNESAAGVIFKMKRDPRITKVGAIIRKTSIDELPQLINVLRGEMSLVGPRPPLPSEVAQYSRADRARLNATPGITCLWQVAGRSDIPFDKQVKLDVRYIEKQSIWLDLVVLLKTIPAVIKARGAY
ncbi:MAG: sugar transferase [Acidiferrobacterales bacterium]|nr:sugar transferase [Acidiferrobacterales bacterium]